MINKSYFWKELSTEATDVVGNMKIIRVVTKRNFGEILKNVLMTLYK